VKGSTARETLRRCSLAGPESGEGRGTLLAKGGSEGLAAPLSSAREQASLKR